MSTAKPRFISKRVNVQTGWIWGGVLKEDKPTHFGFSHNWECQTSVCRVDFSSPSHPSVPVPPGACLLHQCASAAADEKLSAVRDMLCTVTVHTRGCAVAFSHQLWLVSAMLVAYTYLFLVFCWTLTWNSTLFFYFNSLDKWLFNLGLPISPLCFSFSWILATLGVLTRVFDRHLQSNLFPYSAWDQF